MTPQTLDVESGPAIQSLTRLVADGRHNAFTDLHTFKGQTFLTYRSSSGHGRGDGVIKVKTTTDFETWTDAASPFTADRNYYEGHMLTLNGRLYMFGGSYDTSPTLNKLSQQQMMSWTDDGKTWAPAQATFKPRWRFWRPIAANGRILAPAYTVDYSKGRPDGSFPDDAWRVVLLVSNDGIDWEERSVIADGRGCNETQLYLDSNGTLHAYLRRETGHGNMLHTTTTGDYKTWSQPRDRGMIVQGQNIQLLDGRLFMIGRHRQSSDRYGTAFERRDTIRAKVWVMEKGYWVDYANLPSGADCSYAGIAPVKPGLALVSYYSQHKYLEEKSFEDMDGASDIFIAKLRTDLPADWGYITPYGRKLLSTWPDTQV